MSKLVIGNSSYTPVKVEKEYVPAKYSIQYDVDENGVLNLPVQGKVWPEMDLTGVSNLGYKMFEDAYLNMAEGSWTNIEEINLRGITNITNDRALYDAFYNSSNILLPNLKKIDLHDVVNISGNDHTCYYTFYNVHNSTTGNEIQIDLSSLENIYGYYTCEYMFRNMKDLRKISIPKLKKITGQYAAYYMFAGCDDVESINLDSLTDIIGSTEGGTSSVIYTAYMMFGSNAITSVTYNNLRSIYLPSLKNVYGVQYMFAGNANLSNIVFGTSDLVLENTSNLFRNCKSITSIDFMDSVSYVKQQGAKNMFAGCSAINGTVHLRNIECSEIDSFNCTFSGCDAITSVVFDSLYCVNGYNSFNDMFNNAGRSLTDMYFPKLYYIQNDSFNNALNDNCNNVTLHFSSSVENDQNFQDIIYYVGGNNTNILFDLPAITMLEITFANNINFAEIYDMFDNLYCTDENNKVYIPLYKDNMKLMIHYEDNNGEQTYYNFDYNKNVHGLYYTFEEPQNKSMIVFDSDKLDATIYDFYMDIHKPEPMSSNIWVTYGNYMNEPSTHWDTHIWLTPGIVVDFTLTSDNPVYALDARIDQLVTDGSNTNITVSFPEAETVLDLNENTFSDYISFEPDDKWSIEEAPDGSGENILRIHQDVETKTWQTAKSIPLNIPNYMTNIIVTGYANADSEKNYDFGYICVDDGTKIRTAAQIKSWNQGGELVFKDHDVKGYSPKYFSVQIPLSSLSSYNPTCLTIGFGQDSSSTKGTNSFYVKNIKIIGF